jgi:hypothetical protein
MKALSPTVPKPPTPAVESVSPPFSGAQIDDFNTKALTQWNPMTAPVPQVQRSIAPPISIPDFPRRKF